MRFYLFVFFLKSPWIKFRCKFSTKSKVEKASMSGSAQLIENTLNVSWLDKTCAIKTFKKMRVSEL